MKKMKIFMSIGSFKRFKTEAVIKSMDWFLYDNGLRLERVKRSQKKLRVDYYCWKDNINSNINWNNLAIFSNSS